MDIILQILFIITVNRLPKNKVIPRLVTVGRTGKILVV